MVSNQRPNEFLDMDRRLRYEEPERSQYLTSRWNLVSASTEALDAVASLLSDLSGWPDPFEGGVGDLDNWPVASPTRNVMRLRGITKLDPAQRDAHLDAARQALHVNFSIFKDRGVALGWSLPGEDEHIESLLGSVESVERVIEGEAAGHDVLGE